MDRFMDRHTEFVPILREFVPYREFVLYREFVPYRTHCQEKKAIDNAFSLFGDDSKGGSGDSDIADAVMLVVTLLML